MVELCPYPFGLLKKYRSMAGRSWATLHWSHKRVKSHPNIFPEIKTFDKPCNVGIYQVPGFVGDVGVIAIHQTFCGRLHGRAGNGSGHLKTCLWSRCSWCWSFASDRCKRWYYWVDACVPRTTKMTLKAEKSRMLITIPSTIGDISKSNERIPTHHLPLINRSIPRWAGGGSGYLALLAMPIFGLSQTQIRFQLLCNLIVVTGGCIIFYKSGKLKWKDVWPTLLPVCRLLGRENEIKWSRIYILVLSFWHHAL